MIQGISNYQVPPIPLELNIYFFLVLDLNNYVYLKRTAYPKWISIII